MTSCGRRPKSCSRPVLEAINWIEHYASVHGDRMPDSNKVMLPYRTEKFSLFRRYREESDDRISRATFYRVWRDHFSHLKVKAVSFSLCLRFLFHVRIQKNFSGGPTFAKGWSNKFYHCKNPYFGNLRGWGLNPLSPLWIRPCLWQIAFSCAAA